MNQADLDRVRHCLDLLQQAQYLVNEAASALCPVAGFANQWSAAGKVYECIKQYWHTIDGRRMALLSKPNPRRSS